MKAYRLAKTNFRYDVFTTLLVSALPSSVKSSLPVLLLACPSLSKKKTSSLQASQSENIICNKEHLYTANYHYEGVLVSP